MLMAGVCQLKAQSIKPFNPADSTLSGIPKTFRLKPIDSSITLKRLTPLFKMNGLNGQTNLLAMHKPSISPLDHMPIYKLPNNSKMAVIALPGYSKMPVIDPDISQKLILKKPDIIEAPKP